MLSEEATETARPRRWCEPDGGLRDPGVSSRICVCSAAAVVAVMESPGSSRERVEQGASKAAPDTALVSSIHKPIKPGHADEAVQVAAALRLYGELLQGADTVDVIGDHAALGEPDDEVRIAAEAGARDEGRRLRRRARRRWRGRRRGAHPAAARCWTAGDARDDRSACSTPQPTRRQTATAIAVFTQPGGRRPHACSTSACARSRWRRCSSRRGGGRERFRRPRSRGSTREQGRSGRDCSP